MKNLAVTASKIKVSSKVESFEINLQALISLFLGNGDLSVALILAFSR